VLKKPKNIDFFNPLFIKFSKKCSEDETTADQQETNK
jgi:hypothetical protein